MVLSANHRLFLPCTGGGFDILYFMILLSNHNSKRDLLIGTGFNPCKFLWKIPLMLSDISKLILLNDFLKRNFA
jgi:hypothetical protein